MISKFTNLRIVGQGGIEAPYDHSDKNSPYHRDWYRNKISREVRQDFPYSVRWEYNGVTKEILDASMERIALEANSDLLVVVTDRPRVVNPDGSINHEIVLPEFVELVGPGSPPEYLPVEGIHEVLEKEGRVIFCLRFNRDRIERRYYNAGSRKWEQPAGISRY